MITRSLLVLAALYLIGWGFSKASRFMKKHDADISGKEKNPWR